MRNFALLFSLVVFSVTAHSATVDTVSIYSAAMHKNVKTVVIKPASYNAQGEKLPVVYLLHGAFGSYSNWVSKVPHIKELVDKMDMIVVCPDGGFTSWYFDSPVDSSFRYESFVSEEVPKYIDAHYNTIADSKGRAL